jgi:hypothetical protein
MWAACSGYLEAVKVLLEKGADPNLKSLLNETALSLARGGLSRRKRKRPLRQERQRGCGGVSLEAWSEGVRSNIDGLKIKAEKCVCAPLSPLWGNYTSRP